MGCVLTHSQHALMPAFNVTFVMRLVSLLQTSSHWQEIGIVTVISSYCGVNKVVLSLEHLANIHRRISVKFLSTTRLSLLSPTSSQRDARITMLTPLGYNDGHSQ